VGLDRLELSYAATAAYDNAGANIAYIARALADIRDQVALDDDAYEDLLSELNLVLDTNRTAPSVMRIMAFADAARVAGDEALDPSHSWLTRRAWRKEAESSRRELLAHLAATLDALIDEQR
jgi:hypothetical protein